MTEQFRFGYIFANKSHVVFL